MNEQFYNALQSLDWTDFERQELNSALEFFNSAEADTTAGLIHDKHYELVFAQSLAILCETPEGSRYDAYLFEEAKLLANYRYFQSNADMAHKMAAQLQGNYSAILKK